MNKKLILPSLGIWVAWLITGGISFFAFAADLSVKIGFRKALAIHSFFIIGTIFLTSWVYIRALRNRYTIKDFRAIGVFWFILYFVFKFIFYVPFGNSLQILAEQCNIFEGRTWIFIPLTALITPYLWGYLYTRDKEIQFQEEKKGKTMALKVKPSTIVILVAIITPIYLIHLIQILFFWGRSFAEWHYAIASWPHVLIVSLIGAGIVNTLIPQLRKNFMQIVSREATKSLRIYSIGLNLAAVIILFFAISHTNRLNQKQQLDSLFKELIANPIPSGITVIDGSWFSWLDSFEDLTFTIEKDKFNEFIKDYTHVPEDKIDKEQPHPFSKGADFSYYYKQVEYKKDRYYTIYLSWDEHNKQAFASINEGTYASGGVKYKNKFVDKFNDEQLMFSLKRTREYKDGEALIRKAQGKDGKIDINKLDSLLIERRKVEENALIKEYSVLKRKNDMVSLFGCLKKEVYSVCPTASTKVIASMGEPAVKSLIEFMRETKENEHNPQWRPVECNVSWAMGKIGSPAVEPLMGALKDESENVRAMAANALGQIQDKRALAALMEAFKDSSGKVRANAASALGKLKDSQAVESLLNALKDESSEVRRQAAFALGEIKDKRALEPLMASFNDQSVKVQCAVAWVLGQFNDSRAVEILLPALSAKSERLRGCVTVALWNFRDPRVVEALIDKFNDESEKVQGDITFALSKITGEYSCDNQSCWRQWWEKNKSSFNVDK